MKNEGAAIRAKDIGEMAKTFWREREVEEKKWRRCIKVKTDPSRARPLFAPLMVGQSTTTTVEYGYLHQTNLSISKSHGRILF